MTTLKNRRALNARPLRGDVPFPRSAVNDPPRRGLRAALDAAALLHRERQWPAAVTARGLFWLGVAVAWVLAIALVPSCVRAQPQAQPATRLVATLGAYHPDRAYAAENGLQDVTPGVGLEREIGRTVTLGAGYYRNSYDRDSLYLAAMWQPLQKQLQRGALRAGLAAMAVSGYPIHGGEITDVGAAGAVVLSWAPAAGLGANLVITPRVADKTHGAIALQLTWRV